MKKFILITVLLIIGFVSFSATRVSVKGNQTNETKIEFTADLAKAMVVSFHAGSLECIDRNTYVYRSDVMKALYGQGLPKGIDKIYIKLNDEEANFFDLLLLYSL